MEITTKLLDLNKNDEETWEEVIKFLDKEVKIQKQVLLFERLNPKNQDYTSRGYNVVQAGKKKCLICEKTDHVPTITNKANMNPMARFEELKRKKFCLECLTPGLKAGHEGRCFDKYKFPDESHNHYKSGLHVNLDCI